MSEIGFIEQVTPGALVFAPIVGIALFVAVKLYVETRALHHRDLARLERRRSDDIGLIARAGVDAARRPVVRIGANWPDAPSGLVH